MQARFAILAAALLLAAPAQAEVVSATDQSFVVRGEAEAAAPPARVWQRLVRPALWWDKAHTWSGDAANLSIDARPGGCFCERLPGAGGVEHMRVIFVRPGAMLRMRGGLGPLQSEPAGAVLTVTLTATAAGTRIDWIYAASGLVENKGVALAGPVQSVVGGQFARLAAGFAAR